jgi:hypothetical protein
VPPPPDPREGGALADVGGGAGLQLQHLGAGAADAGALGWAAVVYLVVLGGRV